jgi:hypothetical protein
LGFYNINSPSCSALNLWRRNPTICSVPRWAFSSISPTTDGSSDQINLGCKRSVKFRIPHHRSNSSKGLSSGRTNRSRFFVTWTSATVAVSLYLQNAHNIKTKFASLDIFPCAPILHHSSRTKESRRARRRRYTLIPAVQKFDCVGGIGQPLSLLLKLNKKISDLALYDIRGTPGVAADLGHIDTHSMVCLYLSRLDSFCRCPDMFPRPREMDWRRLSRARI